MSEIKIYLCRCSKCLDRTGEGNTIINGFKFRSFLVVCSRCGNKRCPHAADHALACTNSNVPGQNGSNYE